MAYFSTIANHFLENKRSMFVFLLFFHVFISVILFSLANSEYFSSLHNGEGLWNFARDSTKYHNEAVYQASFLEKSAWTDWWFLYPDHQQVKLISLIYWLTGHYSPISFEIVNSVVWATSLLLIYKVSELFFPSDFKVPLIVSFFFLQPSVLASSTQLLRDPIFILGFCFICYGVSIFSKQHSKWKWVFIIQIGIVLMLSMRDYVSIILLVFLSLFSIIAYSKKKTFLAPILVLLIPLILFEFITVNRFISPDKINTDKIILQDQIQASVTIEEQSQTSVTSQEKIKARTIAIQNKAQERTIAIQEKIKARTIAIQKQAQKNSIATPQAQENTASQVAISEVLNTISRRINTMRYGFINVNAEAGSSIDKNKKYSNFSELVLYFPRALQVGFLSPFPSDWLKKGVEVEVIGKLFAALEMVIWYVLLLGFVYVMYKNPSVIKPLLPLLIFSITLIVLLGYIIPNVGALYRMRQPYMIPFFLFGAYGLRLMISNYNKRQAT